MKFKLLKASGQRVLCVAPQRIAKAFLTSEVLCFVLQSGGSTMMMQASTNRVDQHKCRRQLSFSAALCSVHSDLPGRARHQLFDSAISRFCSSCALLTPSVLLYIRNVCRIAHLPGIDGYVRWHARVALVRLRHPSELLGRHPCLAAPSVRIIAILPSHWGVLRA